MAEESNVYSQAGDWLKNHRTLNHLIKEYVRDKSLHEHDRGLLLDSEARDLRGLPARQQTASEAVFGLIQPPLLLPDQDWLRRYDSVERALAGIVGKRLT